MDSPGFEPGIAGLEGRCPILTRLRVQGLNPNVAIKWCGRGAYASDSRTWGRWRMNPPDARSDRSWPSAFT